MPTVSEVVEQYAQGRITRKVYFDRLALASKDPPAIDASPEQQETPIDLQQTPLTAHVSRASPSDVPQASPIEIHVNGQQGSPQQAAPLLETIAQLQKKYDIVEGGSSSSSSVPKKEPKEEKSDFDFGKVGKTMKDTSTVGMHELEYGRNSGNARHEQKPKQGYKRHVVYDAQKRRVVTDCGETKLAEGLHSKEPIGAADSQQPGNVEMQRHHTEKVPSHHQYYVEHVPSSQQYKIPPSQQSASPVQQRASSAQRQQNAVQLQQASSMPHLSETRSAEADSSPLSSGYQTAIDNANNNREAREMRLPLDGANNNHNALNMNPTMFANIEGGHKVNFPSRVGEQQFPSQSFTSHSMENILSPNTFQTNEISKPIRSTSPPKRSASPPKMFATVKTIYYDNVSDNSRRLQRSKGNLKTQKSGAKSRSLENTPQPNNSNNVANMKFYVESDQSGAERISTHPPLSYYGEYDNYHDKFRYRNDPYAGTPSKVYDWQKYQGQKKEKYDEEERQGLHGKSLQLESLFNRPNDIQAISIDQKTAHKLHLAEHPEVWNKNVKIDRARMDRSPLSMDSMDRLSPISASTSFLGANSRYVKVPSCASPQRKTNRLPYALNAENQHCTFTPDLNASQSHNSNYQFRTFEERQVAWRARKEAGRSNQARVSGKEAVEKHEKVPVTVANTATEADKVLCRLYYNHVGHKERVLAFSKHLHGNTDDMRMAKELSECTFKPNLARSMHSLAVARELDSLDLDDDIAETHAQEIVRNIKKFGRNSATSGRMRKSASTGQLSFQPKINPVSAEMECAREYLKSNVFKRLTDGVLDRKAREEEEIAREKELLEQQEEERRVEAEDPAPKWWRIQRFLWHQNLCEERRLLNIEAIQKARNPVELTKQPMSEASKHLCEHLEREHKYINPSERWRYHWDKPVVFPPHHPANREMRECSFTPQILKKSKRIQNRSCEELFNERRKRAAKLEALRARVDHQRYDHLTFQPYMSEFAKTRKKVLDTRGSTANYIAMLKKREERRLKVEAKNEELKAEEEIKGCTFKPAILDGLPVSIRKPVDTFHYAERLKIEKEDRIQREKEGKERAGKSNAANADKSDKKNILFDKYKERVNIDENSASIQHEKGRVPSNERQHRSLTPTEHMKSTKGHPWQERQQQLRFFNDPNLSADSDLGLSSADDGGPKPNSTNGKDKPKGHVPHYMYPRKRDKSVDEAYNSGYMKREAHLRKKRAEDPKSVKNRREVTYSQPHPIRQNPSNVEGSPEPFSGDRPQSAMKFTSPKVFNEKKAVANNYLMERSPSPVKGGAIQYETAKRSRLGSTVARGTGYVTRNVSATKNTVYNRRSSRLTEKNSKMTKNGSISSNGPSYDQGANVNESVSVKYNDGGNSVNYSNTSSLNYNNSDNLEGGSHSSGNLNTHSSQKLSRQFSQAGAAVGNFADYAQDLADLKVQKEARDRQLSRMQIEAAERDDREQRFSMILEEAKRGNISTNQNNAMNRPSNRSEPGNETEQNEGALNDLVDLGLVDEDDVETEQRAPSLKFGDASMNAQMTAATTFNTAAVTATATYDSGRMNSEATTGQTMDQQARNQIDDAANVGGEIYRPTSDETHAYPERHVSSSGLRWKPHETAGQRIWQSTPNALRPGLKDELDTGRRPQSYAYQYIQADQPKGSLRQNSVENDSLVLGATSTARENHSQNAGNAGSNDPNTGSPRESAIHFYPDDFRKMKFSLKSRTDNFVNTHNKQLSTMVGAQFARFQNEYLKPASSTGTPVVNETPLTNHDGNPVTRMVNDNETAVVHLENGPPVLHQPVSMSGTSLKHPSSTATPPVTTFAEASRNTDGIIDESRSPAAKASRSQQGARIERKGGDLVFHPPVRSGVLIGGGAKKKPTGDSKSSQGSRLATGYVPRKISPPKKPTGSLFAANGSFKNGNSNRGNANQLASFRNPLSMEISGPDQDAQQHAVQQQKPVFGFPRNAVIPLKQSHLEGLHSQSQFVASDLLGTICQLKRRESAINCINNRVENALHKSAPRSPKQRELAKGAVREPGISASGNRKNVEREHW